MKKRICCLFLLALLAAAVIWIAWGNSALEVNGFTVSGTQLPEAFDGMRIAHVSDLHNAEFGEGNEKLLSLLRDAQPDIIAITGDLVDSRNTNIQTALEFAEEAVKIAPCYYVTGNHESRIAEFGQLEEGLAEAGVTVLRNEAVTLEREGQSIRILGVDDPSFVSGQSDEAAMAQTLEALKGEGYAVLLSHRPELLSVYADFDMDLVLSGHAHGGQFRLPFVGGIIAPNQGLFPKFDSGLYTQGRTHMIVSRGIGNSLFPFRVNNPPELILITLTKP